MTDMPKKLRLAVLASGGGTNLQSMIDRSADGSITAEIAVVLSDRPDSPALERAEKAGIPAFCVNYKSYMSLEITEEVLGDLPISLEELDSKQQILKAPDSLQRLKRLARLMLAERELTDIIDRFRPDYVCLAGFMRLVTPYFIGHFNSSGGHRIINIHPALLPSFPGTRGYEDTFVYGCKWGGITIHFVDEGEDTGPIIAQAVYPILPNDKVEQVRARGLRLEYEMYAQVINWLAGDNIKLEALPSGRLHVLVSDPRYADILQSWVQISFAQPNS